MSTIATDIQQAVEDAAAYLYVWALKDIPQDLRDAIRDARERETSTPGQRVLDTIIRNISIADDQTTLVCQDTGIAVYYCRVGEHFPLHPARIYEALYDGTERATVEHPLRSNTVHPLTRKNTQTNTGQGFCEMVVRKPGAEGQTGDVCHAMAVVKNEDEQKLALGILASIVWQPNRP